MSTESKTSDRTQVDDWDALFNSPVAPGITRSIEAIRRDMPELLQKHRGKWVAYHGDERVGFGRTETKLYQDCHRRGLNRDEFFVGLVEPGAMDWPEEYELTCEEK
jgi:hypothetical protein